MQNFVPVKLISDKELEEHNCLESVDQISCDPETTAFKRQARLHQALWREKLGFPVGVNPRRPAEELGSSLKLDFARKQEKNFLNEDIQKAVHYRLECPEDYQMIDENRLFSNLLSSMPMCFNLFGSLHGDLVLADRAVHRWWPDVPGKVSFFRFEWSPNRNKEGEFLENRSAFDAAFELQMENGQCGVIGIETKYHENCKREKAPVENRLRRYEEVANKSKAFKSGAIAAIVGSELQQIWLDHLLALSMLQHRTQRWHWAKFVLVHPARNPSYARAAERYLELLNDQTTFEVRTIESLLDAGALPNDLIVAFRERYFL
jgi:hypothetical protein